MPYTRGDRLPVEKASKLGHLDIIRSPLVNKMIACFEEPDAPPISGEAKWEGLPPPCTPLAIVFAVDGSYQIVESPRPPYKALAFVKTALFRLDRPAINALDKANPHPYAIRDIMQDAAAYHATVFPMRHVVLPGMNVYDAVRHAIFQSINDELLEGEVFETLKWLAYEKWDGLDKNIPPFECPHCESQQATLSYDADKGPCPMCGEELLLTDMLGFHQTMGQDYAPDSTASDYMGVHETLLLFTGVRHYWENNPDVLDRTLFIKDGPLSIRAQYSKLVSAIRRFLSYARAAGVVVHLVGQEKTGAFLDHLTLVRDTAPSGSMFIPSDKYIRENIQHRGTSGAPYGRDTNYGAKVFVKLSDRHSMVLNVPTGQFNPNSKQEDLLGFPRSLWTLSELTSSKYEGGLVPVELANAVASLSTYPSARVLRLFADGNAS